MRARRIGLAPMQKDRYRALCRCGAPIEFVRETFAPEGHWIHVAGGELCFENETTVAAPVDRTR